MPYKISPTGKKGKYKVISPHGIEAHGTLLENAKKQVNLLRGV